MITEDHISVCIPTYCRNQTLERLLKGIGVQNTGNLFDFSLVVVDNDATGSARQVVTRLQAELGLNLTYSIEPVRSIPAVRNHALALAHGNYIAIIDDDEFPSRNWLLSLYCAIQTFDVDGALGPVYPFFEKRPPKWLLKGQFCERPVYRTGLLLNWDQTRTGNVLLKRSVFDEHALKFDITFKTGGSDREFFKQAMSVGCKFVAVEEAPVYEIVSQDRWARRYYLKRALVNGFNAYKNNSFHVRGLLRVVAAARSVAALMFYVFVSPFAMCFGNHLLVRCLESGAHHLSGLFAMAGIELVKKRDF